jgi:precorrin-2 dehydrogenase/sirohydrochlorin ferrochelatase
MRYYPVQLDIRGRRCLVVGGGGVGTRKAEGLLACGAAVTVVSPEASARLKALAAAGRLVLAARPFRPEDLAGVFLVIGATDDEPLNRRVSEEAERRGILCNIADRPEACNFILPAVVRRGELTVAVSTAGRSPALAKKLRGDLERQFGPEYAVLLDLLGAIRRRLLARAHAPEAHKPLFERLVASDLLELIRRNDRAAIDRLLAETLGEGFRLEELLCKETPTR